MKLGTVGVNLGNVETYRAALKGLSVEQSVFALASKGATEEQIRQILVTNQATTEDVEAAMAKAGLTTATQALTQAEMVEMATKTGVAKATAEELLSKIGITATETGQIPVKKQVTRAMLEQAVASGTLTKAEASQIATMLGLNAAETANIGITNVLTASFAKLWAVITAHPIGAILTAIGVVAVSAVAAYNKWGDTLENTKEKLSDLKSECQEIVSDLQAVNSELETTQQRLEELEGKDTLTFTEKEEYDNLVKINNELQRKIDLLELEEKNKRKEQNKTFVSAMEKDTENPFEHEVNPDGKKPAGQYSISDEYLTSETGYINAQFEIREQLLDDLANAETEKEKERIQKRIDEINSYLEDKNTEWKTVSDGIDYIENPTTEDDKAVNEWLDYIADFQDRMAIAMSKDDASSNAQYKTNTFNRVVDNWQFDETVQGLQDLGKEGKVTAEMLDDPKYDEFINKLVFLGVIDSADNLEDVALAFNSVADSAENAADSASQYGNKITDLFTQAFNSTDFTEQKQALLELAKAGELTPKTLETTEEYNSLLVKTGLSTKELVEQIQNYADSNNDLTRSQARLKYHELVKQLNDLDGATTSQTDSLLEQIHVLEDTIAEYSRLEQQILGTTTAFAEFEEAKNVDSSTDYTSKITEMYASLREGFSSGKVGTEAFKSAFDAIIPENIKNITNETERLTKGLEYLKSTTNGEGIARYFTFDGDSATVELSNVRNFIEDLIDKGVFTGEDWKNFDIAPDMNIDKIVEKTGLTRELIFTMFDEIDNYNVENSSLLDIIDDSLEGKIYRVDTKLADLNEQLIEAARNGDKVAMDNLREQISGLNAELEGSDGLYQQNINNVLAYKEACKSYDEAYEEYSKNIGAINNNLKKAQEDYALAEASGDTEKMSQASKEVEKYTKQVNDATNSLNDALIAKSQFEEPTEMTVQLALDSIDSQIANLKAQLANTKDESARIPIQAQISGLETQKAQIQATVEADTEKAQANLESLKQQAKELQDSINNIPKSVGISTSTAVNNINNLLTTLDDLTEKMDELSSLNISVTTSKNNSGGSESPTTTEGAGAYGTVNIGRAYANGNIGTNKSLKNVMVGEVAPEMVVDPHSGEYTIYQNPTMLDKLPKNAIVFNGKQTEEILKNGMTSSFGKAYVNGNVTGKAFGDGNGNDVSLFVDDGDGSSKKKNGKDNGKVEKDTKNLIDWIARRLEVLQTKADRWAKIIENATDTKKITKYYDKLESVYKKQMKTNYDAASRYLSKANSIKLSKDSKKNADLKNKIQSKHSSLFDKKGNLKPYKELLKKYGEETAEAINQYTDYYDKYQLCIDSYIEACENLYNAPIEEASAKIELLAKSLDLLDAKLDNTSIDNYKDANALIDEQVVNQKDQEKANKSAYNTAKKNLSSAKKSVDSDKDLKKYNDLTKKERDKVLKAVKAGKEIDLTLFKEGSKGYKKALAYNAALQARNDAQQEYQISVEETKKIEREAEKQKFDNIQEYYEKQVELIQIQEDAIQQEIDLAEARGMTVVSKAYEEQIAKEKQKQAQLQKSKEELTKQLNEIEKGTEEWYEANSALADVNAELVECDITIAEMNHSITELADNFQKKMFKVTSTIRNVMDWLASLMGEYDKFDSKTGAMTKEGLATLGTYVSNYNNSSDDSDKYAKQIAKMEEEYAKYEAIFDPNNPQQYSFVDANNQTRTYNSLEEFKNAIDETYESWRDQISKTAKYESQIIDFMRSKYENELGYLKKIIDAKKDELKHEKDLQEYKKSIKSSADSIDSLQKQIMALNKDDSAENQMRLQKLNKELEDSKEELAEKENDRRLSELQDSLDGLYSEYEDLIQSELSDIKGLLKKGIGLAENFSTEIGSTLTSYADKYNYNGRFDNVDEGIEKILNPKDDKTETVPNPPENPPDNTPKGMGFHKIEAQEKLLDNVTTPPSTVREAMPEKKQEVQVLSVDVTKTEKKATSSTKKSDDDGKIKVGEKVKFKSGQYTASSDGSGNKGKQKLGDDVYIQKIVSGAKRPYLIGTKKGGGNLGWVSKSQLSGFSRGGVIEIANLNKQIRENGDDALVSVKEGERILTPLQNQMFEKFINNGLQDLVDASNILQPLVTIPRLPDVQPNTANATQVVQIDNLSLPNVTNYEEFKGKMYQDMQNSKKFETYIRSVSTDRTMGGSRLSKNSIKF